MTLDTSVVLTLTLYSLTPDKCLLHACLFSHLPTPLILGVLSHHPQLPRG